MNLNILYMAALSCTAFFTIFGSTPFLLNYLNSDKPLVFNGETVGAEVAKLVAAGASVALLQLPANLWTIYGVYKKNPKAHLNCVIYGSLFAFLAATKLSVSVLQGSCDSESLKKDGLSLLFSCVMTGDCFKQVYKAISISPDSIESDAKVKTD